MIRHKLLCFLGVFAVLTCSSPLVAAKLTADLLKEKCEGLKQDIEQHALPNRTTLIESVSLHLPEKERAKEKGFNPGYCRIKGKMDERVGFNSQHYSINFLLQLPLDWNGRFFFAGGGSSNGNLITPSLLIPQLNHHALERGYAVVTQDSGHNNTINNDPYMNGTVTFGFDPAARRDFGYRSYDEVTRLAKTLINIYYGSPPAKSYYAGCSEGGREGMMMSQRFPEHYDGIIATAPGFRLPLVALVEAAWNVQAFAELAEQQGYYDQYGHPLISKTFSNQDLILVSNTVKSACDALDGLEDGIIDNFPACTTAKVKPGLNRIRCRGSKQADCLTRPQIDTLAKVMNGARDSSGKLLYADWSWDIGMGGENIRPGCHMCWRAWKLGNYDTEYNDAKSLTLGGMSAAAIFTTPPVPLRTFGGDVMGFLRRFDFDKDVEKIHVRQERIPFFSDMASYDESAWDFMMASSTDLSGFQERNGKLILLHGVSDPIFSINDTINWWNDLNELNNGRAPDFARLFAIPGMGHCFGGPATDDYDVLTALENWVEKDIGPEHIIAGAGTSTPWPGRTRPLCAYPKQARYSGRGSIEKAGNFACR